MRIVDALEVVYVQQDNDHLFTSAHCLRTTAFEFVLESVAQRKPRQRIETRTVCQALGLEERQIVDHA